MSKISLSLAGNLSIYSFQIQNTPLFNNGDTYMRTHNLARYSRFWMLHFLPYDLVAEMHSFSDRINSIQPTQLVLCILSAMRLTLPGMFINPLLPRYG